MLDRFRADVVAGKIDSLAIAGTMTNETRDLALSWRSCLNTSAGLLLSAVTMLEYRMKQYINDGES